MNTHSLDLYSNKENQISKKTPRVAENRFRSFGHDITNITLRPLDIDSQDSFDPQRLGYYAHDIFNYLQSIEKLYIPREGYMRRQHEINEGMRAILIDWVIEVHLKFKLLPETLYLAVNLIDRYLEIVNVSTSILQLIGVSALLIACKYEEIYFPDIKDLAKITDDTYTKAEILEMEAKILSTLQYNITTPSSFRFLERYSRLCEFEEKDFHFAQYLIEMTLMEYKMIKFSPSIIAISAVYLTNKLNDVKDLLPSALIEQTKYSKQDLKACTKELQLCLQNIKHAQQHALVKKFSLPRFSEVAKSVNLGTYL
ncbi:unnamed protein product [Blepharisma stoltei]|uniref:Cyclin N-terminal domain-containing protein n=1 Tax=Blepharisma stoltei TaxID=1481888 RepID=A0AAU9IXX3_9CILI|nr:unnamed protein product [Blepharisma stoltei]